MKWRNPYITDELLEKEIFHLNDIKGIFDIARNTIITWEHRGIIKRPRFRSANGRRIYQKKELIKMLSDVIEHRWKSDWGLDFEELIMLRAFLKKEGSVNEEIKNHHILRYRRETKDKRPRKLSANFRI